MEVVQAIQKEGKVIYNQYRKDLGEILRQLTEVKSLLWYYHYEM